MLKKHLNMVLLVTMGLLITVPTLHAEVVTDGTVGPGGTIAGPNYDINETFGTLSGSNLFHSFTTININTGETATFSWPAAAGSNNIVGRVTGGTFSNIDGSINSTVSGANLWLVNPNGVVFGSNASINVLGSFHASTAENIKFDDGTEFGTSVVSNPVLSVANPEGFGFVSVNPASTVGNNSNLSVANVETLSLVAGEITLFK